MHRPGRGRYGMYWDEEDNDVYSGCAPRLYEEDTGMPPDMRPTFEEDSVLAHPLDMPTPRRFVTWSRLPPLYTGLDDEYDFGEPDRRRMRNVHQGPRQAMDARDPSDSPRSRDEGSRTMEARPREPRGGPNHEPPRDGERHPPTSRSGTQPGSDEVELDLPPLLRRRLRRRGQPATGRGQPTSASAEDDRPASQSEDIPIFFRQRGMRLRQNPSPGEPLFEMAEQADESPTHGRARRGGGRVSDGREYRRMNYRRPPLYDEDGEWDGRF